MRTLLLLLVLGSFSLSYGQIKVVHSPDSLYFIQVAASKTYSEPELIQDQLNLSDSLGVIKVNSWYKYFIGAFETRQDAQNHMTEGEIDGYVTQYFEGEIVVKNAKEVAPIIMADSVAKEEPKVESELKKEAVVIAKDTVKIQEFIPVSEEKVIVIEKPLHVIDSVIPEVKNPRETDNFQDLRDNSSYEWVRIGEQVWMCRNLRFKTQYSIVPGTDSSQVDSYGYLYDYSDAVQVCPAGWHLPSDKEWMTLESELGIDNVELRSIGHRSTAYAGISLKSKFDWIEDGNGMDNYGLNILPAGMASKNGKTKQLNQSAHLWSSSKSMFGIWVRQLKFDSPGVQRGMSSKNAFFSVRCIRDANEQ